MDPVRVEGSGYYLPMATAMIHFVGHEYMNYVTHDELEGLWGTNKRSAPKPQAPPHYELRNT